MAPRRAREEQPVAMGLIALQQMDVYQELHGQTASDELLQQVAQTLKNCMHRAGDTLARYGSDQFAFLAPGLDADAAQVLLRQIGACLEACGLPRQGAGSLRFSVAARVASPYQQADVLQQAAEETLRQQHEHTAQASEVEG
jgi:diguanylate cyclase (GGDEF)-like protein